MMVVGAVDCWLVESAAVKGVDEGTRLGFVWCHIRRIPLLLIIGPGVMRALQRGKYFVGGVRRC